VSTELIENFELAAELFETGSRLSAGEYTPPDTTELDSTRSVFSFSTKSVGSRRKLVANSVSRLYWSIAITQELHAY